MTIVQFRLMTVNNSSNIYLVMGSSYRFGIYTSQLQSRRQMSSVCQCRGCTLPQLMDKHKREKIIPETRGESAYRAPNVIVLPIPVPNASLCGGGGSSPLVFVQSSPK